MQIFAFYANFQNNTDLINLKGLCLPVCVSAMNDLALDLLTHLTCWDETLCEDSLGHEGSVCIYSIGNASFANLHCNAEDN